MAAGIQPKTSRAWASRANLKVTTASPYRWYNPHTLRFPLSRSFRDFHGTLDIWELTAEKIERKN